ncbi:actin cytoskeleton-regulatory complex protein pan1-like isoform X2 [Sander lucioperca]|uniref:actin cytoskeleton-regulatory complex protein pan1-like isoform X2 n=1 Tax=Sander lucioperca TaxID=283035 RepID=UPI00125D07E6|nr:actin cytoskeleton-regulatory complex protein pan1-like isoform X2 [Sander lucioperca]
MFKLVILFLTLSGLQAAPLAVPRSLQKTSSTYKLPDGFHQGTEHSDIHEPVPRGFRQGTEPSRRFLVDLNTGLVQEHISEMDRRVEGFGEMERRHWLTDEVPVDVPTQKNGGGWVRVEEPSAPHLPDGFRQGTEPVMSIPDGFRQETEPVMSIPDGFRQGTEPMMSIPDGFRQGTEPMMSIPDGFRQGTEPMMSIPDGFRQGTEPMMSIPDGFRQGTEPMMSIPDGFRQRTEPMMSIPDGFRQGTEPMMSIPDGFRQGTEPMMSIPDGFRQGTEPMMSIPDGFRQGTEPMMSIPDGFRQGTEPMMSIPDGFRQGTEPMMSIPDGFRQGTEPMMSIPDGFRQGTEPMMSIPDGFRQGTEPMISIPNGFRQGTKPILIIPLRFRQGTEHFTSGLQTKRVACKGEVIDGKCYEFNPTSLAFQDAQALCRALAPNAELASVTTGDLHSRLVALATKDGERNPVLTWLGGIVKNQQASWVDGSEWSYSDWMPGHPNIHTDKPVCVEMFKIDESWWTAADCELKRASICSYQITA